MCRVCGLYGHVEVNRPIGTFQSHWPQSRRPKVVIMMWIKTLTMSQETPQWKQRVTTYNLRIKTLTMSQETPQWKQRATTYNLCAPLVQETDNAMTSGEVHNESDMATEDPGRLIIDETPSLAPEQQTNDTEQEIESMKDQDPTNPKIQTKTQTPQSNFSQRQSPSKNPITIQNKSRQYTTKASPSNWWRLKQRHWWCQQTIDLTNHHTIIFYFSKSTSINTQYSSLWDTLRMMLFIKYHIKWKRISRICWKFWYCFNLRSAIEFRFEKIDVTLFCPMPLERKLSKYCHMRLKMQSTFA